MITEISLKYLDDLVNGVLVGGKSKVMEEGRVGKRDIVKVKGVVKEKGS